MSGSPPLSWRSLSWRSLSVALLVVLAACGGDDVDVDATDVSTTSTLFGAAPDTMPEQFTATGFDSVRLRVVGGDGIECAICAWRADTDAERARGLMEITSLGGAFGMVFVFDEPTDSGFWMKDTLVPLTIVYYDGEGRYVGAQDMDPCAPDTDCIVYPAPGEFVYAVEVLQGTAPTLQLEPGSTLTIGEPCEPDPALVEEMFDGV